MKMDRARIVDEALTLLNEVGMDALSTRLLAERLEVRQPALYWHFKNKRALLDAMNSEILARGHRHRAPAPGEGWRSFLADNSRSFRRALIAYRDGGRVHAGTEVAVEDFATTEAMLGFLVESGMPVGFAMDLLVALGRYTLGCVIEQQADMPEGPGRGSHLDAAAREHRMISQALSHYRAGGHEASFEAGLAFILDGAATQLGAGAVEAQHL